MKNLTALAVVLGLLCLSGWATPVLADSLWTSERENASQPKLIVMVAIDQLRRDRMDTKMPGGIGKILSGRNYVEGQLDHGITNTCPGHVVMLTGASPARAGVPGNSFIDRETFETRYCVDDADIAHQVIGGDKNRSPLNVRVDGLGDWLKAANPNSRVFSVGGKDRSSITLGGQHPDGVYWYHRDTGKFTSSGYYTNELPQYLQKFNGDKPEVDGHIASLPARWEHGAGSFRPDDYVGEDEEFLRVSGHPINSGEEIYEQVYRSAYLDQQTLKVASMVAREERLGEGEATDLLTVALSATDTLGHSYGPRSAEALDALDKLDLWLGEFIKELETRLGEGNVLIALSADHGVAELPEYLTEQNRNQCPEQGRISVNRFIAGLYWNLYVEFTFPFERPDKLLLFGGSSFTLNRDYIRSIGLNEEEVLNFAADYLFKQEIIRSVWTREELAEDESEEARLLRNSFVADRSGDLLVQLEEDCILKPDAGTTHGSVYDYDRDVPVVFYGWQVSPGSVPGTTHSVDIGPSLANHIGIEAPQRDGRVLDLRQSVQ